MGDYLAAATAAGILGLDPVGAVVAVSALSLGAGRAALRAQLLAYLAAITVFGVVARLLVQAGSDLAPVEAARHAVEAVLGSARTVSLVELTLGVVLVAAAAVLSTTRLGRVRPARTDRREPTITPAGLALAGVGVAASLLVDPGFLAMVTLAAQHGPWTAVPAFLYWGVWSQVLMVAVIVADLADPDGRLVARLRRFVDTVRARGSALTTILLAVLGAVLAVDGAHRLLLLP